MLEAPKLIASPGALFLTCLLLFSSFSFPTPHDVSLLTSSSSFLLSFYFCSASFPANRIDGGKHKSKVWLERVTIFRVATKPSRVEVVSGATRTALQFKFDEAARVIVIRKPSLPLASDWQINIS